MNKDMLKGKWTQLRGEVKVRWGKLSDNDLTWIEGNYEKLLGKIQESYGYQKEQAQREVDDWLARHPEEVGAKSRR